DIEAIINYCLPIQKRHPEAREEIRHREEDLERILREQQKPVLKLAMLNDRLLVSGGAGTGKTMIAMEVAQRQAEQGKRVALLCFNQLVGNWMKMRVDHTVPRLPNLIVGRANQIMIEMIGITVPETTSNEYWERTLPEMLEERLTDPDFCVTTAFDYLVLDEAQDILARPRLWQCLLNFLNGGEEKGKFVLFGDFVNQVLAERGQLDQSIAVLENISKPTHYHLSENCRNYKIIGDTALRLSGFKNNVYSGYMRCGGSISNYDIYFYSDEKDQLDRLDQYLREFRLQGYKSSEIVILSFCADDACAAARLRRSGYTLFPAWQQTSGNTIYASIHAFKGLESKVVIITDLVLGQPDFQRHLFYTGMTRATESVRVLCNRNSMNILMNWFSGKDLP
ncbi:MAG TPA: hypothetical protein DCY25_06430, partial [Bacteroidales bacterium]|nr:hypothetical protein [Bacteroidales bacterium]